MDDRYTNGLTIIECNIGEHPDIIRADVFHYFYPIAILLS